MALYTEVKYNETSHTTLKGEILHTTRALRLMLRKRADVGSVTRGSCASSSADPITSTPHVRARARACFTSVCGYGRKSRARGRNCRGTAIYTTAATRATRTTITRSNCARRSTPPSLPSPRVSDGTTFVFLCDSPSSSSFSLGSRETRVSRARRD